MVDAHLVEDHWAGILGRTTNKGQLRDLAQEESGLLQFRILNLGFLQDGCNLSNVGKRRVATILAGENSVADI